MKTSRFLSVVMILTLAGLMACGKKDSKSSSTSSQNSNSNNSSVDTSDAVTGLRDLQAKLIDKSVDADINQNTRYVYRDSSTTKCDNIYIQSAGSGRLDVAATNPIGCNRAVTLQDYQTYNASTYFQVDNITDMTKLDTFQALTTATSVTTSTFNYYVVDSSTGAFTSTSVEAYDVVINDINGYRKFTIAPSLPVIANPVSVCTGNGYYPSCRTLIKISPSAFNF